MRKHTGLCMHTTNWKPTVMNIYFVRACSEFSVTKPFYYYLLEEQFPFSFSNDRTISQHNEIIIIASIHLLPYNNITMVDTISNVTLNIDVLNMHA